MSRQNGSRGPSPRPNNIPTPPIRFAADEPKIVAPKPVRAKPQYEDDDFIDVPRKSSSGFIGWIVRTALRLVTYYTLFAAVFTCGSGPLRFDYSTKDSRAVCRSLAHGKQQLVPLLTPVVEAAHQRIDPYAGPYIRAAAPYAQTAYRITKPHYDRTYKHGTALYKKHVDPVRKHAVKRGHAYADPHVKRARAEYKKHVQPHIDTLHKTVKPYRDIYARDVSPYVLRANEIGISAAKTSHKFYVKEAHPRLLVLFSHVRSFVVNHFLPAVQRTYVLYLRPQLDKLTLKVFGYVPDRTVKPQPTTYTEKIKEAASSAAQGGKESLSSLAAAATAQQAYVAEKVQSASDAVLSGKRNAAKPKKSEPEPVTQPEPEPEEEEEDNVNIEELDRQLDAELEHITKELESWERGMGRLIKDELNVHKKRLQSKASTDSSDSESDSLKARKASVTILRRYLREASKAYTKLLDAAKFERSVEDFEGWDKGMGVRVKLFIEDLEELEREAIEAAAAEAKAASAGVHATSEHGQSFVVQEADQSANAEDVASGPASNADVASDEQPKKHPTESEATDDPSVVSGAIAEEPIPLPPASSSVALTDDSASSQAQSPVVAERDPTSEGSEPTFSILPTDAATPPASGEQAQAQDDREPTFSILPIQVDEAGNAFTVQQAAAPSAAADAPSEPTFSILPTEEKAAPAEPTFSILPIDVIDEKGTPAKPIKHEEL